MNIYDFSCNENNVMHKFCNLPTNTIVFFWNVLHLQKLKLKLVIVEPYFKSQKMQQII